MQKPREHFIVFTIERLNNSTTELYEALMDDEVKDALKSLSDIKETIKEIEETIQKDGI